MKTESCLRYLEDPDANAGHLAECAECRALFGETDVATKPLSLSALPMAPWEGASHRAWPIVAVSAVAALAVAAILCFAAGLTPMQIVADVIASMQARRTTVMNLAGVVRDASPMAQVAFAASFLAVNGLLIALLRRAPRGIDA